ncbi:hypothetical protein HMPREF9154_0419 [Arachnia propionica F0230a]|nr:hypothetical protein HMPREF9154_0419 [Arachnia propionica F0230a]
MSLPDGRRRPADRRTRTPVHRGRKPEGHPARAMSRRS